MGGLIPDRIQIRKVLERWENEGGKIMVDRAAGELEHASEFPIGRGEQQRAAELGSLFPLAIEGGKKRGRLATGQPHDLAARGFVQG